MGRARNADIVIALYNGHSGFGPAGSSVGICQAELQSAVDSSPEKVRLVALGASVPEPEDANGTGTGASPTTWRGWRRFAKRMPTTPMASFARRSRRCVTP
jgi:hypothetical protein